MSDQPEEAYTPTGMSAPPLDESWSSGDRVPPHSVELEQQVLGAMLMSREAIEKAADMLDASVFYRGRHRHIWQAILTLVEKKQPADIPLIADELERLGVLDECGGTPYLADVVYAVGTSENVEHHGRLLLEKAVRRKAIALGSQLVTNAWESPDDIFMTLERFEQELYTLALGRVRTKPHRIQKLAADVLDRWKDIAEHDAALTGVPCGFWSLDKWTNGFQPGEVTVLTARPSHGKSIVMAWWAANAAKLGFPALIFSLEMSGEALAERLLSAHGPVSAFHARNRTMTPGHWKRAEDGLVALTDVPLWIEDRTDTSPRDIRSMSRRMSRDEGLRIIFVDFLQLMYMAGHSQNRAYELGAIMKSLKATAKDLKIPVVILAQPRREAEDRRPPMPRESDLKDSGNIEEIADAVLGMYWPKRANYLRDEKNRDLSQVLVLKILKQRNGPAFRHAYFLFHEQTQQVLDIDERDVLHRALYDEADLLPDEQDRRRASCAEAASPDAAQEFIPPPPDEQPESSANDEDELPF